MLGIIKDIFLDTAIEKTKPLLKKAENKLREIDNRTNHLERKKDSIPNYIKSAKELQEKYPDSMVCISNDYSLGKVNSFTISDINGQLLYRVSRTPLPIKKRFTIYDISGNKVASIDQKMLVIKNPIIPDLHPVQFSLFVKGMRPCILKSKGAITKRTFEITPYTWKVKGSIFSNQLDMGAKFKLMDDKGKVIASISKSTFFGEHHVMVFHNKEYEALSLSILVSIIVDKMENLAGGQGE